MRKRLSLLLLCALFACYLPAGAQASTLRVAGITSSSKAYGAFVSAHSGVEVQATLNPFVRTNELLNALISGGFAYDVFTVSSASFDVGLLMDKGYCADLSAFPGVREAVGRHVSGLCGPGVPGRGHLWHPVRVQPLLPELLPGCLGGAGLERGGCAGQLPGISFPAGAVDWSGAGRGYASGSGV